MPTPLEKARLHRDLTQWQVAAMVGISQPQYFRVEKRGSCSREIAEKLARIFRAQGITEIHILYPRRRAFRRFVPAGRALAA
jgi:hypothetical protein